MNGAVTGLLVMSYGTARDLDDVEAYYTHIRGGRSPSPELLEELRDRYRAIGGRSPLLEITEAQIRALEAVLNAQAGSTYRAYNGMKHQSPYIEDAVAAMAADGITEAVGLVLAPHYSTFSVAEYVRRAGEAARGRGVTMTFVESYHDHPAFIAFVAGRVTEAMDRLPEDLRRGAVVVFSAHSLPSRILDVGDPYPEQLRETADRVADRLGLEAFRVAWQSAGRTPEPWLGPDVSVVLRDLAAEGQRAAVSCPVGFVSDHLEVLYDIDVEARTAAEAAGLAFERTRSPNDDPDFIDVLAQVVRARVAAGAVG